MLKLMSESDYMYVTQWKDFYRCCGSRDMDVKFHIHGKLDKTEKQHDAES